MQHACLDEYEVPVLTSLMNPTKDLVKLENDSLQGTVGAVKNNVVRIDDNPISRVDAVKEIGDENQKQNGRKNASFGNTTVRTIRS